MTVEKRVAAAKAASMIRWKSKCVYQAGQYPVIALVNLFFLLLLLFVLSSSTVYLPGVLVQTDKGRAEDDDDHLQASTLSQQEEFREYVIADKMVLTVDGNGEMKLNTLPVTMETLEAELEKEAGKLLRMYSNHAQVRQDGKASRAFRPKLVLSTSPGVTMETLDRLLGKIRDKKMDVVFKTSKADSE